MSLHSGQLKTDCPSRLLRNIQQECGQPPLAEVLIQRTTTTNVFTMHENLGETMKDLQSATKLTHRQRLCSNVISPDFSIKEGRKRSASSMSMQSLESTRFDCSTTCPSTPRQNVAGFTNTMTMEGLTLQSPLAHHPSPSSCSSSPHKKTTACSFSPYTPSPARFSHSQSSQFASSPCGPSSQASPQCLSLSPVKTPRRPQKSNNRENYATLPSAFMTPGKVRESPISEERPTTFFSDEDLSNDDEMVCLSKYATYPSAFMTPRKVRESPISEERPTTFFSDEDLSNDDEMVCLSKYATYPSAFMTPRKVRESPISEERPTTFLSDEDLSNDDEMVCLSKSPGMARFLDRANGIHSKYSSPSPSSMVTGRGSGLPPRTPVPTMRLTPRRTPLMPPTAPSVGNFTDGDLFESSTMRLLSPLRTIISPLPKVSLCNSPHMGLLATSASNGLTPDSDDGNRRTSTNSSSPPADQLSAAVLQECPPSPHTVNSAGFLPVRVVVYEKNKSSVNAFQANSDDSIDEDIDFVLATPAVSHQ